MTFRSLFSAVAALALAVSVGPLLSSCGESSPPEVSSDPHAGHNHGPGEGHGQELAAATTPGAPGAEAPGATAGEAKLTGKVPIVIKTSMGTIEAELDADKAPGTVANFVGYVKKKHYDGTIWHRVISTFMIQGGGMTPDMEEKPTGGGIKNEGGNGLTNVKGSLAMARTPDPDSASAQFFINVVDNDFLDRANAQDGFGYAVFGKVTKGMDVVDKIRKVPTTVRGGQPDVPEEAVMIESIRLQESAPKAAATKAPEPKAGAPK